LCENVPEELCTLMEEEEEEDFGITDMGNTICPCHLVAGT